MIEYASNYRAFLESRRFVVDPNEEEGLKDQGVMSVMSWVYMDSLVIAALQADRFELTIGNQSVRSDRLEVLESVLFEYAMSEGYFDHRPDSQPSVVQDFGVIEKIIDYLNKKYGNYGLTFFVQDNYELMAYVQDNPVPSFDGEIEHLVSPQDYITIRYHNKMVEDLSNRGALDR